MHNGSGERERLSSAARERDPRPHQISPRQVLEGVRETGIPITPITAATETPRNLGEWIQVR